MKEPSKGTLLNNISNYLGLRPFVTRTCYLSERPKTLRLAIIEKYFFPVTAGIEVNILETYSVLSNRGFDVTIHTSKDTLTEKDVLPNEDIVKGIKIQRYHFRSDNFGYFPNIDWMNTDLVCLHNFNVFYVWILLYCLWLKMTGRKKFALVVTPHGGFTPEWSIFTNRLTKFKKKIYHSTIGTLLINLVVDKVRAVSEWERMEIIKKGVIANKVVTISNGIEDEAYQDVDKLASQTIKDKVKNYGRYIIQIGRVYPIKNYETTIRAMTMIPNDIKFIIVGPNQEDNNYLDFLKELIAKLGLEGRVIFLDVVSGIDKFYLIKHALMMTHMSMWESFCNVVHEGLSQGLICLVANNTALPLLIKDGVNGYCLDTRDWEGLAKKINYVLEYKDSQFLVKMRTKNKQIGRETRWSKVAQNMKKLYLSLRSDDLCLENHPDLALT